MVNFSDPEGYIDSSDDPPLPDGALLHCTYTVTVYTGYGVELQVRSSGAITHVTGVTESLSRLSGWASLYWMLQCLFCALNPG